ncbi:MAG: valine--tRNA ligase [Candidatus Omnitrophica bacterium]|nr:valine--tRNA ligase [Candidatus Omnitrophota bacterium]
MSLPPRYAPKDVEKKWYAYWEEKGYFQGRVDKSKKPYTIVIPPPNITGSLHMGHALNNTIQDILIRSKHMQGYSTLWIPGVDHAGIATQNVVEKELKKEGKRRQDLGREKFLERVWQWREKYGHVIVEQLRRLGSSCDWSRLRFTMDEGLSKAVREEFVSLYEDGLIYRGNFIINWCIRCQTALSDIEVEHEETRGHLYYIKYPLKDGSGEIIVATTRPESMLGDTAVTVHPEDKRYKDYVGKKCILPLVGREILVLADDVVDPEFGTGAVKVTPAHDATDFEIGKRHKLEEVVVINEKGRMTDNAGKYKGLDRFKAREKIIEDLKEQGLLIKTEDYEHAVGKCSRCQTVVEPLISLQWFVRMKELAKPAIEAVEKGDVRFVPDRWTKVYLNWMENIRDWCISRQIWWGHRIPVWYCRDCNKEIASRTDITSCPDCKGKNLTQDENVLDTWFSSALWPFSTLGWPDETEDLEYFYPTATLVTGYDIIFFWVARMIMMGLKFKKEIPFRDVYITGIVRDRQGRKMSKSLGNVIDPLDVIDKYGTDSFRLSLAQMSTLGGQDIFLSEEKLKGSRNFVNKLWNVSRFYLLYAEKGDSALFSPSHCSAISPQDLASQWILCRMNEEIKEVNSLLDAYRFHEASSSLYEFVWHELCDWYVEFIKPGLNSKEKESFLVILAYVLKRSLKLLHPFMPFITEELWHELKLGKGDLIVSSWPEVEEKFIKEDVKEKMDFLKETIIAIRHLRTEAGLKPRERILIKYKTDNPRDFTLIQTYSEYIKTLTKADDIVISKEKSDKIDLSIEKY